jgi:hypothetical protein
MASSTRRVAIDHMLGAPVDHDGRYQAHLGESTGDSSLLLLVVDPPVQRMGQELVGRHLAVANYAGAPRGGGLGSWFTRSCGALS